MHVTEHAKERMAERGITFEQVEKVINNENGATLFIPSKNKPSVYVAKGLLEGRAIEVVFDPVTGDVITLHWASRKRRAKK